MRCPSCCYGYLLWNLRILIIIGPIFVWWASSVWHYPFWWWWLPSDRRLCELVPSYSERADLNCFYVMRNRIVPFRIEMLHRKPDLARIDNLLPDEKRRQALNRFILNFGEPSPTYTLLTDTDMEAEFMASLGFRVSNITSVFKSEIPETKSIYELIDLATGLTTDNMDGPLSLQTYVPIGHIVPHHDVYPGSDDPENGRRFSTLIVYLLSPSRGGATIFPGLGLGVDPKAGDAIYWFNTNQDGEPDRLLSHAGCPVFGGRKTIGTFWFRQFLQEFRKPCTSDKVHFKTF